MRTGSNCTMFVLRSPFYVRRSVGGRERRTDRRTSNAECLNIMIPTVVVSRGRAASRERPPWVYRADLVDSQAQAGDRVVVRGPRGRTLGQALYSDRSQIAIRMLTRGDAAADDEL